MINGTIVKEKLGDVVDGTSPAWMPASSLQGRINGRRATAFPATTSPSFSVRKKPIFFLY
jgi:hypothetical protein